MTETNTFDTLPEETQQEVLEQVANIEAALNEPEPELSPSEEGAAREAVEALKNWQENVLVTAIANGIRAKYVAMLVGQRKGQYKGPYNIGYMNALKDIHYSLTLLIQQEGTTNDSSDTTGTSELPDGDSSIPRDHSTGTGQAEPTLPLEDAPGEVTA